MRKTSEYLYYCILIILISGCSGSRHQQIHDTINDKGETDQPADTSVKDIQSFVDESEQYLKNRDLDGDGISDDILFDYTGGAHCCYKLSLKLSSMEETISYPFEMDGGYGFGIVDGSQHDHFDIDDYDNDGLPEIFMGISTYNGEIYPIESEWTEKYGIKSNYILFDYRDGKIVLLDYDKKKHLSKPK